MPAHSSGGRIGVRALNHLGVLTQPSSVAPNVVISPAVQIAVQDARGTVGAPVASVTIALSTNPGGGTLAGTLTQLTVNGIATFSDLSVNNQAVGYTLIANAPGLAGVTTSAFTVTAPVDAGQSTVSASSPVNLNTLDTITVTAKDAGGNPLSGKTVSLAVSGSGNTVNQPGSATDGSGVATGSFQSSVAETKTVQAMAGGVLITQQPSVVVQSGGGPTPTLLEDFSTYPSNANFISDPRGIYVAATDEPTGGGPDGNGWQFLLDQSVGLNIDGYSLTQSMRYDQVDLTPLGGSGTSGRCTDHTVDRGLAVNSSDVWVEVYIMFSSNYTVVAPSGWGCTSGQEYKLLFGGVDVTSRFNLEMQPSRWIFGYPTNETAVAITNPVPSNLWDGKWHQYRFHFKIGQGTGRATIWFDGVLAADLTNINTGSNNIVRELYLGVNLNQGPGQTQHIWWGRIAAYYQDPGW